ncbi:plasmid stabilization protein [Reyranella sp. CPCC 100927]|uniref:FitA-like ribbon-helix-helix domain-containing protein n=1 Tax=Reyranella sp. CPCC 100927 TaxID=2599616 RepID=UPI0011B83962|nr:plasmid stabilization protein [Reyranella sp. CPCC 100927]TWS93365.1 plasmid stabilization protein [Reyranella sp. CPCC 100927]
MPAITIRNLPEEVHRALKVRAARHGRSTEAEVRDILETAVRPAERVRLGDALAALGRRFGLKDQDLTFERDKTPAEPINLE